MARLDEQNINTVKKAVSIAAPTGGIPVKDKRAEDALKTMMRNRANSFVAQGSKITPKVKSATKSTGKPTTAPVAKEQGLKVSTYNLPEQVRIGGYSVDVKDIKSALKKILSTYGENSKEFKNFMNSTGANLSKDYEILSFSGSDTYKKPDLRNDPKSYVDTAQVSYSQNSMGNRRNPSPYIVNNPNRNLGDSTGSAYESNLKSDQETASLLNKLGYDVFKRNLKWDKDRAGYKD